MRTNALQIIPAKHLGGALLLLVLISASPGLADDPRAAKARLDKAAKALIDKTKEVVEATKELGPKLDKALKRINDLERNLKDYGENLGEANKHAQRAAELAEKALEAAKNCHKKDFDQLSKEAKESIKKAKPAQDRANKFLDAAQNYLDSLRSMGDQEYEAYNNAAVEAGLGGKFHYAFADFEVNKERLLEKLRATEWKRMDAYEKAAADLHGKILEIDKAKIGGVSPDENLNKAEQNLREGKALRDKPCPSAMVPGGAKAPTAAFLASAAIRPSPGAAGPGAPVDMTVVVDNRPKTLVCILPGDNVERVAAALGLADYQVIATTATGTIIAAYGDPQTIEAEAREKGIPLCFVEINFCVIKAPLTAFRGHQHKAHPGGIHNHDAPDPPWNWAVTPPEPVVSWGGR